MANVRFTINRRGFVELNGPNGDVGRGVARAAGKVRDDAKRIIGNEGRVNTGALRQSIRSERTVNTASRVRYQVGTDLDYAMYQHEGVRGPIVPRRARVLRFKPKGGSAFIFRPRVSGFSGIHFLTRPLRRLTVKDFIA